MKKLRSLVLLAGSMLAPLGLVGCYPFSMGIFTPVPVQPWTAERMEEKFAHRNEHKSVIMPAIQPGKPLPPCDDPPAQEEILRAMPRVARGVPYVCEEFRDNVEFVTERLVDKIDPPRFFPLVGQAQLHHCHWKCTVYYTETIESGQPFPFRAKRQRVEVIYIDKDHLHLYPGGGPESQQSVYRDLTGN